MLDFKRVLVLAPHTDDAELGCGGTIVKLLENHVDVHIVVFSICEVSVPPGFPRDVLATEVRRACGVLGLSDAQLQVYRYPVRYFPQHRQDILERLVAIQREFSPDTVFVPAASDVHQDHQVIYQEGVRAFKRRNILGYELPWNTFKFDNSGFVILEERHIQKKLAALEEYNSQKQRNYWGNDVMESLARVRGIQVGAQYAEAFQLIRGIIR